MAILDFIYQGDMGRGKADYGYSRVVDINISAAPQTVINRSAGSHEPNLEGSQRDVCPPMRRAVSHIAPHQNFYAQECQHHGSTYRDSHCHCSYN